MRATTDPELKSDKIRSTCVR